MTTAKATVQHWGRAPVDRATLIDTALGRRPADTVVLGGSFVNVHTGTITGDGVAIAGGRVAAIGDVRYCVGDATRIVDARDRYVVPGLVVAHMHQWHSNHNGTVFAQCMLEHGSTCVTDGFYGPGIVAGVPGVRLFLDEIAATPLKLMLLVPTHAYAQNRPFGLDPAPDSITAQDLLEMLEWPETYGVEETGKELLLVPERRDPAMVEVLDRALQLGKIPTGHGIGFASDREVNAWIAAGIMNNHEAVTADAAAREAELGLSVLFRQAPLIEDMPRVVRAITERRLDARAFGLCADWALADSLFAGQQDVVVRAAIRAGLDPIRALQMTTIQPAEFFRVNHAVGSLAPGRFADMLLVDDLPAFSIDRVLVAGDEVVRDGELVVPLPAPSYPDWAYRTVRLPRALEPDDLVVPAPFDEGEVTARVIELRPGEYLSREAHVRLPVRGGAVRAHAAIGVNAVALIDRLRGDGRRGVGFVRGFNLRAGAIASAVNPLTQALVVVGVDADEMAVAANAVRERGGAFVAVRDGQVIAEFPTPLLGMASDLPYAEARASVAKLLAAWRELGCELASPTAMLELVAAASEPTLRISTEGLTRVALDEHGAVDLASFAVVPTIVEAV